MATLVIRANVQMQELEYNDKGLDFQRGWTSYAHVGFTELYFLYCSWMSRSSSSLSAVLVLLFTSSHHFLEVLDNPFVTQNFRTQWIQWSSPGLDVPAFHVCFYIFFWLNLQCN
jgi:hypothetical protein